MRLKALVLAISLLAAFAGNGLAAVDNRFPINMTVQTQPQPAVTFSWTGSIGTTSVMHVERRLLGLTGPATWTSVAQITGTTKTYTDTGVLRGNAYEFRLYCTTANGNRQPFLVTAVASLEAPLEDQRGGVILVVDNATRAKLGLELQQLEMDLVGDGWFVKRVDTDPAGVGSPTALKSAIKNLHQANPGINSLLLFGNVPYVRSGALSPDGHSPGRAHETDTYFADLTGTWTDTYTNVGIGGSDENENIPGDGKFDQYQYPAPLTLATGRVYFENMVLTRKRPLEYLRDYLHKDHAWRHAWREVNYKALAGNGTHQYPWYNWLTPIFGSANMSTGWFSSLETESRIFGVGTEAINLLRPTQAIFMTNFLSYKQHWLRTDNYIVRNMAQPDWGLTSTWGARPTSFLHSMAAGKPIGWGFLRSQNDVFKYYHQRDYYSVNTSSGAAQFDDYPFAYVSYNLLGDPTLRLHPVPPPSRLDATRNGGTTQLSWTACDVPVVGYHVYRSSERLGPYTRLTTTPVTGLALSDNSTPAGEVYYQVRAVVLMNLPATGAYYNQSQGAFTRVSAAGVSNRAPIAAPASTVLRTKANTPLWFRCQGTDADGDPVVPIILKNPQFGQIRWRDDQPFYISAKDFSGTETITYVLSDGIAVSEPAEITIHVDNTGSTLLGFEIPDGAVGSIADTWHSPNVQPATVAVRGFATVNPYPSKDQLAFKTFTTTFNANNYLEWTVAPLPGYRVSLDRVSFALCAGVDQVVGYELRVSKDDFATWSTVPSQFGNTTPGVGYDLRNVGQLDTFNLAPVAALQGVDAPIKFRLHLWKSGNPAKPVYLGRLTEAEGSIDGIEDLSVTGRAVPSTPLTLQGVVSRKTHGIAGDFDIVLPAAGTGIESRSEVAGGHTIVLTFSKPLDPLQIVAPAITGGELAEAPSISGTTLVLRLAQIANATRCTVGMPEIAPADGGAPFTGSISFGILEGDINANRAVTSNDATELRKYTGGAVNTISFRSDLNADGAIDGADAVILRRRSGTALP